MKYPVPKAVAKLIGKSKPKKGKQKKPAKPKTAEEKKSTLERRFDTLAKIYALPVYVTQYQFHPVRKWPFDIAWPDSMVAIEIQGETNHARYHRLTKDAEKHNAATLLGWRILYVTGEMLKTNPAPFMMMIKELL